MKTKQKSRLLHIYLREKTQVDKKLQQIISSMAQEKADEFNHAVGYTVLSDGKRIRPLLAIEIYRLFPKNSNDILPAACALELLHASSLMLDDLPSMDDASVRRGKSTSHIEFSESTTILAAAALWTKAYEILATYDDIFARALTAATASLTGSHGLIIGQFFDLEAKEKTFTKDELLQQYDWKTASLFRLAARFGAILGGADNSVLMHLDTYAKQIGIAFQIHDDIIDATMTTLQSGKDAHKDTLNHKQNIVDSIGLEKAKAHFMDYMKQASESLSAAGLPTNHLQSFTDSLLN